MEEKKFVSALYKTKKKEKKGLNLGGPTPKKTLFLCVSSLIGGGIFFLASKGKSHKVAFLSGPTTKAIIPLPSSYIHICHNKKGIWFFTYRGFVIQFKRFNLNFLRPLGLK